MGSIKVRSIGFEPQTSDRESLCLFSRHLIPRRRLVHCPKWWNVTVTARFLAQKFLKESPLRLQPIRVNDLGFPLFPINEAASSHFSLIYET